MKAAVLTGIEKIEIADMPAPAIQGDKDVLIRVQRVGLCGSDMHYYRTGKIGSQVVEFPFVVGHECAGQVEQVGSGVKMVKVGDRVAVDPAVSCNQCDQCRAGRGNTCRKLKFLGCPGQMPGALCEYLVMPEQSCFPAGAISLDQAVLTEPLAISLYAVNQAQLDKHSDMAVLGAGPIGLGCILFGVAASGGKCFATELIAERIEAAAKAGADYVFNPKSKDIAKSILAKCSAGVDVVFECAGRQETLDEAVEILKPGGKLMMIGIPEQDRVSFVIDRIRRKELTMINVRRQNECTDQAVEMVADGQLDADFMITHHFDISQIAEAFDIVANYRDGVIKAMVKI